MQKGRLWVICGPALSGKTSLLFGILHNCQKIGLEVQGFKASFDMKDEGLLQPIPAHDPWSLAHQVSPLTQVVGISQAQFFSDEIIKVVEHLLAKEINIIVEGSDTDFRGEPFGAMPSLIAQAEERIFLKGICRICGAPATRTQRLIDGKPAPYDSPLVMFEGVEYEPRCALHHEVPGKPIPNVYCPRLFD